MISMTLVLDLQTVEHMCAFFCGVPFTLSCTADTACTRYRVYTISQMEQHTTKKPMQLPWLLHVLLHVLLLCCVQRTVLCTRHQLIVCFWCFVWWIAGVVYRQQLPIQDGNWCCLLFSDNRHVDSGSLFMWTFRVFKCFSVSLFVRFREK